MRLLALKDKLLKMDAEEQKEMNSSEFINRIKEYNPGFFEVSRNKKMQKRLISYEIKEEDKIEEIHFYEKG